MPDIPKTEKKLREAKFFLGKLVAEASTERLDREDFEFYLNGLLAAGRSVTFALQFEQKSLDGAQLRTLREGSSARAERKIPATPMWSSRERGEASDEAA